MAHGVEEVVNEHGNTMKMAQSNHNQQTNNQQAMQQTVSQRKNVGVMGSRRIFAAAFKLKVLDSYRNDIDCRGNQRATARKYGIHRRQIQKWLQCEDNLRSSCAESNATTTVTSSGCCEVPVGRNSGVSASPGLIAGGSIDVASKVDSITSSSSSLSTCSSSTLININTRSPIVNCNVIASIGIAPSSGTPISAPAVVGTVAAPALNLSLARLHGDEQQHHGQAAPPPHHPSVPSGTPMRHSIRRASSPLQYLQHNNNNNNHHQVPSSSSAPLRGMHVTYENKQQQEMPLHQQHSHQRHSKRQQPDNDHRMTERLAQDASCSPEIKYSYVMPRQNYEHNDVFAGAGLSHSTNPDDYYQTLESYHKNVGYRSNLNNNNVKEIGLIDESFSSYRDKSLKEAGNEASLQYEQTGSFASCSASSLLVLHATTIKSERSSPDSLATPPGPFGTPGSPESAATMPRPRNHNDQHHHRSSNQLANRVTLVSCDTRTSGNTTDVLFTNTKNENVVVANAATGSAAIASTASVAVHSNETPSLAHVHVGVDSHARESRVSEKRQQGRELQHRDSMKVEYEERIRRMRVKEEVAERDEIETTVASVTGASSQSASGMMMMARISGVPKREMSEEEVLCQDSRYNRESTRMEVITSCPDYQASARTPTGLSSVDSSGPVSPIVRDSAGTYSGLSSPRAASSSGISTSSSCSDSEIDPLDYSSSSTRNVISDLSRRRSFSLRFKLDVLDAFHSDIAVAGNQRATARKFGINRRQVQKWLGQESELRGEIALRGGDLRQRLGPVPEINNSESSSMAVDLRTSSSTISSISGMRSDVEFENSSSPLYCCDVGSLSQRFGYYRRGSLVESPEIPSRACTLSCCMDSLNGSSMMCYQETASHRRSSSGYPESQSSLYCYSPRDPSENGNEPIDVTISVSPLKRSACTLNCCYEMLPSPKRICSESLDKRRYSPICQDQPPQEVPLCLVKPKFTFETVPMQTEPVTSTVPTPPAQHVSQTSVTSSNKRDAILFKPYLDNPVSKPTEEKHPNLHNKHGGLSPLSAQSVIVNNNNNCHDICNLNEDRTIVSQQHDYALELSLRVPVSWGTHHGGYGEFPERMRSAFVRYPTSPHYT